MSDLGDLLRSTREQKKVSLLQAASATRIKVSFLEALEQGEYSVLPGSAYVTGFLRNYARFLGLHPDDVIQDYFASRPYESPTVKAATRVLANGQRRAHRTKLFYGLSSLVLLLSGGFAVKQYNDAYGKTNSPPVYLTPNNLGTAPVVRPLRPVAMARPFSVALHATAPVWVRVTVDGARSYEGILRVNAHHKPWKAIHSVLVLTLNGTNLKVTYNGKSMGRLARQPGMVVDQATNSGWRQIS